jgi:ParB/RepB/Spo0J family partition protein
MNIFNGALRRGAKKEEARLTKEGKPMASRVQTSAIPLEKIETRENVRKNTGEITELAASIKKSGLQQPITVYPSPDEPGRYVVKFGHRRLFALRQLAEKDPKRWAYADCIISDAEDLLVAQVTENVQRNDLTQGELCDVLIRLREEGRSHKEIATILGKSEKYVRNIFVGVNEIMQDVELRKLLCPLERTSDSSLSIQEIANTKSIEDRKARLSLLAERQEGRISQAQLYEKAKQLSKSKPGIADSEIPIDLSPEASNLKPVLDGLPLHLWADECEKEIRIRLPEGDSERFRHLTGLLVKYLDRHPGYYLTEGGVKENA